MALCIFGHASLVSRNSQKLLKLEPWNLKNRLVVRSKWPDYAPISNEILMGHIILPSFVHPSVCPLVTLFGACHILRTLHARVLKFYIWVLNEKIADLYFCSCPAYLSYAPLKIEKIRIKSYESQKILKLGSWNIICWLGMIWRLLDLIFREFHEKIDVVMALCNSRHFNLVSKISQNVFKPEPWYLV